MIVSLCAKELTAGDLSPQEERGREIYMTGASSSGREIIAFVGQGMAPVPASSLPCGNCHGSDGLGRPEGGVVPSNITWSYLTKSYGVASPSGEWRPPYTAEALARAITFGADPAGNRLDISMPRYRMATEDMEDLLAYLKQVETYLDPGLAEDRIVLGTIVPGEGPLKSLGEAMQAVLEAYFSEINGQGGIYGRRLDLQVNQAADRTALLEKGRELVEQKQVFALAGPFTAGVDKEFAELAEQNEMPMVGPFALFNQDDDSLQRFTFYLQGGLSVQARALVDYASRKVGGRKPQAAVIYPPGPLWTAVAEAIEAQAGKHQWPAPLRIESTAVGSDAGIVAARLKEGLVDALFFFGGSEELVALSREAGRFTKAPYLFLSGSLVGKEIFEFPLVFQNKIFLAYALDPSDQTREGVMEFSTLQRRHGLVRKHLLAQISTYVAAKVLVEGLKRAGRDLSREKLIAALEKMYQFETGLTPKITYSPNRHIGAMGAHIVAFDLKERNFVKGSEWIGLD